MASLTIYLDEATLRAIGRAAEKEGSSVSSWAKRHLANAATPDSEWPEGYLQSILAFDDTSDFEEPGEIPIPLDDIVIGRSNNNA